MVHIAQGIETLVEEAASKIADKAVVLEKSKAPVSSGNLMASIHKEATSRFSYIITTNASGDNGFQYPARIEAGQAVVPTRAKYLHFYVHGNEVYTKRAKASIKSHFAKNTKDNLHI